METGVHANGIPFDGASREPAAFTSVHPAESGEMVDTDSDPDPTPMASLQPESLDETVVAEEERGGGEPQHSELGIGSGKTKTVPIPASDVTGLEASAHSSDYHSLHDVPTADLDYEPSSPDTSSFYTAGSLGSSDATDEEEEEEEPHDFSVEIPSLREVAVPGDSRSPPEGGSDDTTPIAKEPRQHYVPDQPKLLLHEPPVVPRLEKEPLPPSSSDSDEDQTPRPPRTQARGLPPKREPRETTPLLSSKDHDQKGSCCKCCTLL